ncbi:MAG TPA: hypothetical protein VLI45_09170 [Acidobacteriaceae bacterium]|nr:hypothetical protein [Acidobacteriaceae bacterium]
MSPDQIEQLRIERDTFRQRCRELESVVDYLLGRQVRATAEHDLALLRCEVGVLRKRLLEALGVAPGF